MPAPNETEGRVKALVKDLLGENPITEGALITLVSNLVNNDLTTVDFLAQAPVTLVEAVLNTYEGAAVKASARLRLDVIIVEAQARRSLKPIDGEAARYSHTVLCLELGLQLGHRIWPQTTLGSSVIRLSFERVKRAAVAADGLQEKQVGSVGQQMSELFAACVVEESEHSFGDEVLGDQGRGDVSLSPRWEVVADVLGHVIRKLL